MTAQSSCLMCRIAAGEIPAHVLHSDDRVVAFLDIQPIRPAHLLIIPRAHHEYFDRIPHDVAAHVLGLAQRWTPVLRQYAGVERVAFFFTGIDLPHAHAHLMPMHELTDITSKRAIVEQDITIQRMPRVPDDELKVVADTLRPLFAAT